MNKAILATDLSEASELLIKCCEQYKEFGTTDLTLFHALGVQYMNFYGYVGLEKTKAKLTQFKNELEAKGFTVDIVLKEGLPYFELEEYSKEHPEALIIIGTKGMGFLKGLIMGSTANHVIRMSKSPVLIVQCNEQPGDDLSFQSKLYCCVSNRHILFPTDFSDFSSHAFELLKSSVASRAEKIVLMHVQDAQVMKNRTEAEIKKFDTTDLARLERLKTDLQNHTKAEIHLELKTGIPVKEILEAIPKYEISLVVMGAHGRSFIADHILGSVTRNVIEESKTNCLIVPIAK